MSEGRKIKSFGQLCTSCGVCCRRVDRAAEKGIFPKQMVRVDGSCTMLLPNNRCSIYGNRPTICRVDQMYYHMTAKKKAGTPVGERSRFEGMTKKQYYEQEAIACNNLQVEWEKEKGVDLTKLRVII